MIFRDIEIFAQKSKQKHTVLNRVRIKLSDSIRLIPTTDPKIKAQDMTPELINLPCE